MEPKEYSYKCLNCGNVLELTKEEIYKLYDQPDIICPNCGSNQMEMTKCPEQNEISIDELERNVIESYKKLDD